MTALPIIETQAGDVSAYVPTNVISITDGQIYLETDLFNRGNRPAINVGLSVSRVGGAAQIKAMKKVAGTLRLDLAQIREMEAFAQFGSDLDAATQKMLAKGAQLTELLKQPQYAPLSVEKQVALIYAGTNELISDIPNEHLGQWETGFLDFLATRHDSLMSGIKEKKELDDAMKTELEKAIAEFNETFKASIA